MSARCLKSSEASGRWRVARRESDSVATRPSEIESSFRYRNPAHAFFVQSPANIHAAPSPGAHRKQYLETDGGATMVSFHAHGHLVGQGVPSARPAWVSSEFTPSASTVTRLHLTVAAGDDATFMPSRTMISSTAMPMKSAPPLLPSASHWSKPAQHRA